jgi:hypothetical protein
MRKMRKVFALITLASVIFMTSGAEYAFAATGLEVLVQKLEEKGILTQYEAQIILEETKNEIAKAIAETKAVTAPTWTQKISMKGDIRYRNQFDWNELDNRETRYRQRVRARLALKGKVNEDVEAGMRMVTGNTDPVSTNQTLGDFFGSKTFMLDRAYIKYTPQEFLRKHADIYLGMFANPFYSTELLWDSDVSFGGAAIKASINTGEIPQVKDLGLPSTDLFVNAGQFPLDELSVTWEDPWLWAVQGGFNSEITDGVNLKSAVAHYTFEDTKRYVENHSQGGNIMALEAGYGKNFKVLDFPTELGIKDPLRFAGMETGESPALPYLCFYGDYAVNTSTGEGNNAWLIGTKLGHKKVSKKGQWQLAYDYRDIESNAMLDVFPDSDFHGTGTGAYGHNVRLTYGIAKNTTVGAEWYYTTRKDISSGFAADHDPTISLIQLDAQVKF